MSDLDEIAAAAGISVVDDDHPEDSADADRNTDNNKSSLKPALVLKNSNEASMLSRISELEMIFDNRYTDLDPEYLKTIQDSSTADPPCVTDFFVRRQRDDSRSWHRNRGGHFDGGDRRDYRSQNRDRSDWNRGYHRSYGRPGNYGDNSKEDRNYRPNSYRDRSPHR